MLSRAAVLLLVLALSCRASTERPAPEKRPDDPALPEARRGDGSAIEYTLRFEGAHNHYIDVSMSAASGGADHVELVMAVWTPGSYLVREFARHLEDLRAVGPEGEPLAVTKTRKNRWRVATGGAETVSVTYRLYAREATVRTNFVDADVAMLNGAPTFLTVAGAQDRPHDVLLIPRESWERSVTGLRAHPGGGEHHYLAADYDELVDSPIVIGNPAVDRFEAAGAEHVLATFLGGEAWEDDKAARDVETLVAEHHEFWRVVPYERYVFLNVLLGGGGGLEHLDSTLMIADRWMTRDEDRYRRWLGLVSHELFHTWNVKRLRPVELGPFDYENEVYTRGLWIAEGITSYYDDLLLRRAGLMTRSQYLEALSGQIRSVQTTPGRALQPLSRASFDAWIEYYRSDENTRNTAISYYTKGAVVAFLLDAEIRRSTGGRRSLDDLLRLAYERFSGERGFTIEEFRDTADEVAGTDLSEFFARYVDGTAELDYQPALDYFGLRFQSPDSAEKPHLGVATSGSDGRLVVQQVTRGTAAYRAGVNVGDELIALGRDRIPRSGIEAALERLEPGAEVELLVARRGQLRELELELGEAPAEAHRLEIAPTQSATQAARMSRWLDSD